MDIFDNTILCKDCGKEMFRDVIIKDGIRLRVLRCDCGNAIIHPEDKIKYEEFKKLRQREFDMKLRMVGNSYTVSIPHEIINFIKRQEKIMNDMVKLNFDDANRISLSFGKEMRRVVKDGVEVTEVRKFSNLNGKRKTESAKQIRDIKTGKIIKEERA